MNVNFRAIRKYRIPSIIGSFFTGILEFAYILGFLGKYTTTADFAVISLLIIPLVAGFYCDQRIYQSINGTRN